MIYLKSIFALFFVLLQFIITVSSVSALSISSPHIEMETAGRSARGVVRVTNTGADILRISMDARQFQMNERGDISTQKNTTDDLIIFPLQFSIPPYSSQAVRLQWVGDPDIIESKQYLLFANEVPIKNIKEGTSKALEVDISIAISFRTLVTIKPLNSNPELIILNSSIIPFKTGAAARILFENRASTYGALSNYSIQLGVSGIWDRRYSKYDVRSLVGIGLIPPRQRREIILPLVDFPISSISSGSPISVEIRPDAR